MAGRLLAAARIMSSLRATSAAARPGPAEDGRSFDGCSFAWVRVVCGWKFMEFIMETLRGWYWKEREMYDTAAAEAAGPMQDT